MKSLEWYFPLPRCHTGVCLGNGRQGMMVWGTDTLNLTTARSGFWDHRGGAPLHPDVTFANVRRLLVAGDEKNLRALFASPRGKDLPQESLQYGGGRLELTFPRGLRPYHAELDLAGAKLKVELRNSAGDKSFATIRQAMLEELTWIDCDDLPEMRLRPSWEWIGEKLSAWGVSPPTAWSREDEGGFVQTLPEDDPLCLAWHRSGKTLAVATALGQNAGQSARDLARLHDRDVLETTTTKWWQNYWQDVPRVELPDTELQHSYDYGLWKQAGLTPPHAPPAGLQGPWMEETHIPPWSNDFHFNINVQMIYTPCLATNRADHFRPLWKMIRAWLPRMQKAGQQFFGRNDTIFFPHAVDDRGTVCGSFWSGTIDHACASWMAQLAWQHYRHTLEEDILREVAWPLLVGAFNGYWAMAEETPEGGLSLPVTVSPEYNGAQMNAWGRDASFQLAAFHRLAQILPLAADRLGEKVDPRWAEVSRRLPEYTLVDEGDRSRIALWQNQDLDQSHRHHSHLAGIYPFTTYSPRAPEHRQRVASTLQHWTSKGAGFWTGWCVPWAASICLRCDLPDAAIAWLHWFRHVFTNVGHGTLHNADFEGASAWANGAFDSDDWSRTGWDGEFMQMDAAMGVITAILELLVSNRRGIVHVLPCLPRHWRNLTFDGVRVEGAFLVGATLREGLLTQIRVTSLAGEKLSFAHGWKSGCQLNGAWHKESQWIGPTTANQTMVFTPVS